MIVGIHQPNFIPWLGYFYKINRSDRFVLLDDVQYTKNSFINRNRIKGPAGEQWVTIPVLHTGNYGQKINETQPILLEKNYQKFVRALIMNYSRARHFSEVMPLFGDCDFPCDNLALFNEGILRKIVNYLEIETPITRSSSIDGINALSTERLIQICQHFHADQYLAGFGSRKYQEDESFRCRGIIPVVYDFEHPVYEQLFSSFVPKLSIIDILMNLGKDTIKYL